MYPTVFVLFKNILLSCFLYLLIRFFDCLNVRSTTEHKRRRNGFLAPYTITEDGRFDWLQNTFLAYLDAWYEATQGRPGNFSGDDRSRMFLSLQTYKGLQITVHSLIEAVKFLLSEGMEFVLSERFCQDLLEEYFVDKGKEVVSTTIQQSKHLAIMTVPLQYNATLHLFSKAT